MTSTQELRKPTFIKVKDIQRSRSGYNVYVKVISAEVRDVQTQSGDKIRMVDAVVGDQTAIAKAFFKGDSAKIIEKGKVIAIRNGVKKFIKNFISLELDIFGRITEEKLDIKVDETHNISTQEHKLSDKPRRDRNFDQRPKRDNFRGDNRGGDNRRNFRGDNRRDGGNVQRDNRRGDYQNDRRGNQDNRDNRRGDYQNDRRGGNQDNRDNRRGDNQNERREGGRNYNENRPERRQNYGNRDQNRDNRPTYDRDFDRRKDNNNNTRPQRRENNGYEPRQEFREKRNPPMRFTKLDQVQPGDERLNLIVKIITCQRVEGKNSTSWRCVIGDESATAKAFIGDSKDVAEGKSVALFGCDSQVFKEHIEIRTGRYGRVEASRRQITNVNEKLNISDKAWVLAEN